MTQVAPSVPVDEQVAILGNAWKASVDRYEWAKGVVGQNKSFGTHVTSILDFGEMTAKMAHDASPIKLDEVIGALDTRVDQALTFGSEKAASVVAMQDKLKHDALTLVHDKLTEVKGTENAEVKPEDLGIALIADDVKTLTTEKLGKVLDVSESYLAQYLPIDDEDLKELSVDSPKHELKTVAIRSYKQGKIAAKGLQESVISKMSNLQMRAKEVVHVDLIKYSEYLNDKTQQIPATLYVAWENVNESVTDFASTASEGNAEKIKEQYIRPARERLVAARLQFHDRLVNIWTVVGDKYEQRIMRPGEQIIQMFREELALQQELAMERNGSDDELTIAAGLNAVVAAARARLSKEIEVRVYPAWSKYVNGSDEATVVAASDEANVVATPVEADVVATSEEVNVVATPESIEQVTE